MYPGDVPIAQMYAEGGADAIWGSYIRYIGAGAVAAGGIISLIKSLPLIVSTFKDSLKGLKGGTKAGSLRTEQDLDMRLVLGGSLVLILVIWLLPAIPVSLIGALLVVVFGFFFATVSSRMVGLVGSSNNPVSGMAIATLLFSTLVLKVTGNTGVSGMIGAIAIGSVICIVAAMAGDTSQDLKTGYILGATPKKQQIGELLGAVVAAFTIGGVLLLLNSAWGFGTTELAAPQATLMKMITDSFEVHVSDCEEIITSDVPSEVTKELAKQKAEAVFKEILQKEKEFLVIGADTVVSLQGKIYGKPKDREDAFAMLSSLQGRTHEVTTGVALLTVIAGEITQCDVFSETTEVEVAPMTAKEIEVYIETGDCYDKAGAYGIQGVFSKHIAGIKGDYFNVVGFPIHRIYEVFKKIEK